MYHRGRCLLPFDRTYGNAPQIMRHSTKRLSCGQEAYVAVVEVCGLHDWLVHYLRQDERCHRVLVIQPLGRSASQTDRRDAHGVSELLWVNRERLRRQDRVQGVRTVQMPSAEEQAERRLTQVRERLVRRRTQTLNPIHKILRRPNLEWEQPTKTFQTLKVRQWLKAMPLEPADRLAMDQLRAQWQRWDEQLVVADGWMAERFRVNRDAQLLATMPGVSRFIAVAITSRINPIARFPHGRSLANFLGLTPGCRSSGDKERVGSITKVGSRMVRYLLAQLISFRDEPPKAFWLAMSRSPATSTELSGVDKWSPAAGALAVVPVDQRRERRRLRDGHDRLERQRRAVGVVPVGDAPDRVPQDLYRRLRQALIVVRRARLPQVLAQRQRA
jgi:transposase